ncbi:hypothetical protein [Streptomyces sp. NPDC002685]|uniref:hypothetical protein n=1 Tax=Streptomyces sp. NPDC002685 TaxID=3154540 RepID=UPI00331BDF74
MSFLIASGHVEVEAKTDAAKSKITALVGALGALGPVAGVAAAGMAAAGAGVAAFGVAAGKQIADLKKASEAQSKYQDAVAKSGRGSQEAAKAQLEVQKQLARMPKATQEASAAFGALKDSYSEWSDSLAGDTMPVFTKSFQLFQALLPKTTGLVQGTSRELDRLVTMIAGGVASPGFDDFVDKLTAFSAETLHHAVNGLVDLSRAVGGFAAGGGFDGFIDTAKEVGPLLAETLGNLAKAVLNLAESGGDVGVTLLTAANALAKLVNAIPPEALGVFMQFYAVLKLVKIGMAGVAAVSGAQAAAGIAAFVRAARFGGVGSAISGVTQRMSTLSKVAGGLGILGAVAVGIDALAKKARGAPPDVDKLATSLKTLAATGETTGELAKTFPTVDAFVAKLNMLQGEQAKLDKGLEWPKKIAGVGPIIDTLVPRIDDLVNGSKSLGATKEDFKSFDQALADMVNSGYADQAAQSFRDYEAALKASGRSQAEINELIPAYTASVAGLKADNDVAAKGMGVFGQQALETGRQLETQKRAADGLRQSIINLNDTNRGAYDAQIAFEQGVDDLTAAFKENGATLDIHTEAGRKNGEAMSKVAKARDEMIVSGIAANESLESMNGKSEKLRGTMMRLATEAFDGNKQKAKEYVNQLLSTPEAITTMIKAEKAEAIAGLQSVQAAIKATPGAKSIKVDTLNAAAIKALEAVGFKTKQLPDGRTEVFTANGKAIGNITAVTRALNNLDGKTANTWVTNTITTRHVNELAKPGQSVHDAVGRAAGGPIGFAGGGAPSGRISGPGTSSSDSIPAMLSDGEWVIRAAAVEKYGDNFLAAVNEGRFRPSGFAKGGKSKKLTAKQKAAKEAAKRKADAEKQRQKEGRSELGGDVTLTTGGRLAGYKNTEAVHDLGMPDSVSSLVSSINTYLTNIKKAFSGSTEKNLVAKMTASGKALLDNQKKLESVNKSLDNAKNTLDDLKGKFDSLKTSVASSLVGFGNITKIGKYGTSPETLIKQLQSDTSRTTEFSKQLDELKKKGLNSTAISDIAAAGVTGGGMATAQSLLNATPEQIAQINALQAQLQKSANAAGTTAADAMYGAGIKAAEGLVKGLTAQQKAIEATMMAIAKSMEKAIKKALGIKSPSKVMEAVGDYSFQGIEQGWVKRMAKGNTLISGSNLGLRMKPATMPGAGSAQASGAGAVVVHLTNNFSLMTMPSPAERRTFVEAHAKDINDVLLAYQKARRR